jgi:Domain of unknown function (DUF4833)
MRKGCAIRLFWACLFTMLCTGLSAQSTSPADTFPVPSGNPYQLFYLQRQPNTNTIAVELNIKNGQVDLDNPVHVYWLRYQHENGQRVELNFIQRNFAYGMNVDKISPGIYNLSFVSYKKLKIRLERGANNVWRAFFHAANGSNIILKRIYLHINGGTLWKPKVDYVELKGLEQGTYKEVRERINVRA